MESRATIHAVATRLTAAAAAIGRVLMSTPVLLLASIAGAGALIASYSLLPTTFDVDAQTESVDLISSSVARPKWAIRNAQMFRQDDGNVGKPFSGVVQPAAGVGISMSRIASGPLRLRFLGQSSAPALSVFEESGRFVGDIYGRTTIRIDQTSSHAEGSSIVFPLFGKLTIGQEVNMAPVIEVGLIRHGVVRLTGHSPFSRFRFEAGTIDLSAGDRFQVVDPLGDGSGLVRADERPGLQCVYRVVGSRGLVSRFGAQGYDVATTLGARVRSDGVIQGLWAVFLFLFAARKLGHSSAKE